MPQAIVGMVVAQVVQQVVQMLMEKLQEALQNNSSTEDTQKSLNSTFEEQGITDSNSRMSYLAEMHQNFSSKGDFEAADKTKNVIDAFDGTTQMFA
jgi:acyl carrier protein